MTVWRKPSWPRGFVPFPDDVAERYRAEGAWRGATFSEAFAEVVAARPDAVAVIEGDAHVTHVELDARSRALCAGFRARGITAGDAVVLLLPGGVAFVETLLALFRLGACPVMAQPAHRLHEVRQFARLSAATAMVIPGKASRFDYGELARHVRAECPRLRHTFVADGAGDDSLAALRDAHAHADGSVTPRSPLEVALFQLSGGSTATSKLIARTHADYLYSVEQSNRICGFDASTVYLAVLPAAHNFTLSSPGVLGALLAGGSVVFAPSPAPADSLRQIERHRVTATALVPALVPAWLRAAGRSPAALKQLSLLQVGGARLSPEQATQLMQATGGKLQQVFGMAEGLVCYTRPDGDADDTVHTQGAPMSELDEVRIVDDEGRPVSDGVLGHLQTRGPYTIRGYFDAPAHDANAFTPDGFYQTGDLVRRNPRGQLIVEGRAKDQINRGGEKIAAPEVEAVICTHPSVVMAALVPVPDSHLGERSCAFVVVDGDVSARALRDYIGEQGLAAYKVPDRIEVVAELPKTPVGKIDKRALAASLRSPDDNPASPELSQSPQ